MNRWTGGLVAALCGACLLGLTAPARAELKTDVEFAKVDGVSLTLDANVPDGAGPFPTAILVHGGGFVRGDKQSYIKPIFEPLTQAGFTWFTINYRLAPKDRYPACVEDVERAIRWVKDHAREYKVDPERIALIGESAGGHLVSMAGARGKGKTRVAAVVPFYAPHDLDFQAANRKALGESLSALFGLTELNDAARKVLRDASPSSYVRKGLPPYLLIHGTNDAQVPYEQSVRFAAQMKAAGNRCELFTVPDGAHGMGSWDKAHPEYKTFLVDWLRRTFGPGSGSK
jgi:alpha-L-fucosidase 2